jgi:hypothetical protein
MAVTRYEWTCPGCGKRFAVREGLAPALCPGCQSAVPAAPFEEQPAAGPAAVPPSPDLFPFDDLTDDFVSRPRSAPSPRPARPRSTADRWVWTIDPRFERFLTPHFIRVIWLLAVAAGMTVAIVDIGRTASRAWSPQPAAVDAPRVGEQVAWNFGLLTARLVAVFVAVMSVRVSCEGAIVIFRMADSLEAIREAAARQSAQQND